MSAKESLREQWQSLQTLDDAPLKERQKRGYQLETLIYRLLELEGWCSSFRPICHSEERGI